MNVYPSNRVPESNGFTKAGVLRYPVLAIAAVAGSFSVARADNTWVQANMTFPATASCNLDNCTTASGSVILVADCSVEPCNLDVGYSFDVDCAPFNSEPVTPQALDLYENQTDDCAGSGTQVDLLAASPTLPRAKWDSMAKGGFFRELGDWIIVADLGPLDAGGNAIGSGTPRSANSIPTLSEWAVFWMTLLLLVTGTIVFGRSHRRARVA